MLSRSSWCRSIVVLNHSLAVCCPLLYRLGFRLEACSRHHLSVVARVVYRVVYEDVVVTGDGAPRCVVGVLVTTTCRYHFDARRGGRCPATFGAGGGVRTVALHFVTLSEVSTHYCVPVGLDKAQ